MNRWSRRDSNPRPLPCRGNALPAELRPQFYIYYISLRQNNVKISKKFKIIKMRYLIDPSLKSIKIFAVLIPLLYLSSVFFSESSFIGYISFRLFLFFLNILLVVITAYILDKKFNIKDRKYFYFIYNTVIFLLFIFHTTFINRLI